jgi:uncharacterized protein with von Willebrand factor type A (vWA) domain
LGKTQGNSIRVLLLMDAGGSMWPYSKLCNQLFTAVNQSNHFKDLQIFYFHNCIYDWLFHDAQCSLKGYTETDYILKTLSSDYRLIIVGDASMAPYELMRSGGVIEWGLYNEKPGIEWLKRLKNHFEYSVWLNPIAKEYWGWTEGAYTLTRIAEIFPMEELSVDGLEQAIKKLKNR